MRKIIVVNRGHDVLAHLEDFKGVWGCGKDKNDAVGDLIISYPNMFDLEVEDGQ